MHSFIDLHTSMIGWSIQCKGPPLGELHSQVLASHVKDSIPQGDIVRPSCMQRPRRLLQKCLPVISPAKSKSYVCTHGSAQS